MGDRGMKTTAGESKRQTKKKGRGRQKHTVQNWNEKGIEDGVEEKTLRGEIWMSNGKELTTRTSKKSAQQL